MNAPNLITLARLLSVPLAVWLIAARSYPAAFWLFVGAGVSDAADGFIARTFRCKTELGAVLDPIADKSLLVSVYLVLGLVNGLPLWLPVLVILRDAMILGGFLAAAIIGVHIRRKPLGIGKVNTAGQIALAGLVLARLALPLGAWERGAAELTSLLVYAVAATTLLTGSIYLRRWIQDVIHAQAGNPR